MTTSAIVHSQAFGFMKSLQSGVDPRTGLYTVSIELPAVSSNWLCGPAFPLSLSFSPINTRDSGYGVGWNLNLSQFTPADSILALSTGETYKVTGSGAEPDIKEKKLDSFHFENLGNNRYRVTHKSGLIEVLQVGGSSEDRVALPVEIYSPAGHCLKLVHASFRGGQRLQSISDAQGELLRINRANDTQVEILARPDSGPDGAPLARYEMNLNASGWVTSIVLPTDEKASWRFGYGNGPIRDILCLHEVKTPVGGRETIEYGDDGHPFPAGGNPKNLPRVTRHNSFPGFGQPKMEMVYRYTTNNFLGNGTNVSLEPGMDPMYNAPHTHMYGTTACLMDGSDWVRKVERTFNRFHLLTEETTTQGNCVKRIKTEFYAEDVPFSAQPPQFQLPKKITTNWELTDDPTKYRSEVELSAFDVHGNPIEMIDPSGFKTERIYYPKEADPNGFVRFLKETTVTPSPIGRVGAPTLCTRYTYRKMPPLAGSDLKEWMTVESETLLEMDAGDEKVLQLTERTYADVPEEPFLHGRPLSQRVTLNDMPSLTEFAYRTINSTLAGDAVLETIETFTGFDHGVDGKEVQKITREQHSLATGKPVVKSDINNVQTLIVYDALGRVTRETVAPDEPDDTASRHYDYFLTSIDGQQASQVVTDVKGIRTLTRFDGLNRTIYVGRQDIENPIHADDYRQTYAAEFDALGNLFRESRFDWIDAEQLELSSEFAYSAWGEQSRETGSDGIAVITELSPFGKLGPTSRSWTESTDQPPKVSGLSVSEYNCFGKVDVIKRFDTQRLNEQLQATLGADDKPNVALYLNTLLLNEELPTVGSTSYVYDGHGNCTQQNELLSHTERSTVFEYDKWARMVSTTLPDQTNVRRTYAQHSSAELPVSLQVVPGSSDEPTVTIGQQTFDGLSRLTALEVGPRIEQYRYNAGQMQFYQRLTPSDRTIDYTYRLNLTEQPILIKSAEDTMSYVYDEISASITNTTNNQGSLRFEYNSLGNVFRENWTDASGVEHKTLYGTSLLGRLLSQSHTDGPETVYTYDSHGRTVSATQGSLSADFEYNSLGQACRTTTKSLKDGNTLVTDMFYDTLGREVVREMRLTGHVPRTILQTWYDDDQLRTRHLLKGKQSLLKEEFLYDSRSRLIQHTCSGDTLPRDVFGNAITKQVFRFDAKDNIKHCTTTFKDGKRDVAVFSYALDDSCQLIEVTHTFTEGGYTARQKFEYDADGNMLNDEQGQRLRYDSLGRLLEVKDSGDQQFISRYRYNGHNHLIGVRQGEKSETLRFYQGYNLSYTRQDDRQTHFLFLDNLPLGEQQANHDEAMLLLCDASPSVIGESLHGVLRTAVYSVYGERSANDGELQSVLAFNAEVREETTGWYLLGRGYRAYNPGLMRFHSPDSLSPFGAGGINPYVYCLGNPVFFRDPTGHRPAINRPENPGYTDPYEQPKRSFWEKFLPAAGALLGFIFAATMVPWTAGASVALFLGITGAVLTGGAVIASVYGALKEDDSAIVIGQWLGIAGAVFGAAGAITGKVMAHFATKAAGTAAAASSAGAGTGAGAGVPAAGVPAAGVPAASAGSVATAVPAAGVSNVGTQTQRPAATPPPSPTPGPIETRSSISSIDSAHTTRRNSITDATDTRSSRDSGNVKVRPGIRALINRDNENMKNNVVTSTDSKEVYLTSSTFLQHR